MCVDVFACMLHASAYKSLRNGEMCLLCIQWRLKGLLFPIVLMCRMLCSIIKSLAVQDNVMVIRVRWLAVCVYISIIYMHVIVLTGFRGISFIIQKLLLLRAIKTCGLCC